MKKFVLFCLGVVLLPLLLLVCIIFPRPFYREYKWLQSERTKDAKALQKLDAEFEAEVKAALDAIGTGPAGALAVKRLTAKPRYQVLTAKKEFVSRVMTVVKRLLPDDVFKKNEFTVLYFVKMSMGFITGKSSEAQAAEAFARIDKVEDLVLTLIKVGVVTEEVFMRRFVTFAAEDVQGFLEMQVESFTCNYQEPGPCGQ